MRNIRFLLAFIMLTTLMFVGCADEQTDQYDDDTDIQFMAAAQWKCGRTMAGRADAEPITIAESAYPELLHITVGDEASKQRPTSHPPTFVIGKTISEDDNTGFVAYHDQYRVENLRFDATGLHAVLDEGNSTKELRALYSKGILTGLRVEANTLSPRYSGGTGNIPQAWDNLDIPDIGRIDHLTTKAKFGGSTSITGKHLFLTLGHVTAMLRLHVAVSAEYSKVRYIDLKSITINDKNIAVQPAYADAGSASAGHLILPVDATLAPTPEVPKPAKNYSNHVVFAHAFLKPPYHHNDKAITTIPSIPLGAETVAWNNTVGTTTPLTFVCTYDIYDKDAVFTPGEAPTADALTAAAPHLTRYNVTATNTVTLKSTTITAIRAGYYYDLYITINPDYLYVLSEHDNKHLTVN